jgi:hypothetical protein
VLTKPDAPIARLTVKIDQGISGALFHPAPAPVVPDKVCLLPPQFCGYIHDSHEPIQIVLAEVLVAIRPLPVGAYGSLADVGLKVLRTFWTDYPPVNQLNSRHQKLTPAVRFRLIITANTAQVNVPEVLTFRNSFTFVTLLVATRNPPMAVWLPKSIKVE